jgi:hypothetical protein
LAEADKEHSGYSRHPKIGLVGSERNTFEIRLRVSGPPTGWQLNEHAFSLWTDRFEVTTPSEEFINARCFGKDFAQWLSSKLQQRGISVSEPIQEDWAGCVAQKESDAESTDRYNPGRCTNL